MLPTAIILAIRQNEMIAEIKRQLQEYWVNELQLPMEIQLKSMTIIDMVVEKQCETE